MFQKTITKVSFYLSLVSLIQFTMHPFEKSGCSSVGGIGVRIKSWEGRDDCKMPLLLKKLLGEYLHCVVLNLN